MADVPEGPSSRRASGRHASAFDLDNDDKLRRVATRVCTIFGVAAVLGLVIGAFVYGIEPAPVRTRGELLIQSCHLPAVRASAEYAADLESPTVGDRLLPWPAHVLSSPNTDTAFLLSPVIDFHLSAFGFAMRPDVMELLNRRVKEVCAALNRVLTPTGTAATPTKPDVKHAVLISHVVLSISSTYGNATVAGQSPSWDTLGTFSTSAVPQFPMYESYTLVVHHLTDSDLRRELKPARSTDARLPHRRLAERMAADASGDGLVNVSSSSVWGVIRCVTPVCRTVCPC